MCKDNLLRLQNYNIYTTYQPLELETQLVSVLWAIFLCIGLLADYLLIRLHGVVVCETIVF